MTPLCKKRARRKLSETPKHVSNPINTSKPLYPEQSSDELDKWMGLVNENIKTTQDKIERIESNIDYAKFEIQLQRIEALEKKVDEITKARLIIDRFFTHTINFLIDLREVVVKPEYTTLSGTVFKVWGGTQTCPWCDGIGLLTDKGTPLQGDDYDAKSKK